VENKQIMEEKMKNLFRNLLQVFGLFVSLQKNHTRGLQGTDHDARGVPRRPGHTRIRDDLKNMFLDRGMQLLGIPFFVPEMLNLQLFIRFCRKIFCNIENYLYLCTRKS